MSVRPRRLPRFVAVLFVAVCWAALAVMLAVFLVIGAIWRDVQAPAQSRLTAGTPAEMIAYLAYNWRFRPTWQEDPQRAIYDPELTYVPKPGVARFTTGEFDTTITMSAAGLRQQPEAAAGKKIVVLGDSFAMGWGVNDAETFSAVLASRYGWPTVNTGVSSYGTARELLRLRRLGLARDARALVVQYCENDDVENLAFLAGPEHFTSPQRTAQSWADIHGKLAEQPTFVAVARHTVGYVVERCRSEGWRTALGRIWQDRLPPYGVLVKARGRRTPEAAAETFLAVWGRFPELVGVPVIVTEMNLHGADSGFVRALRRLAAGRKNFHVVSLTFHPEENYPFDGHINPRGHASAAAQLDRALRDLEADADGGRR